MGVLFAIPYGACPLPVGMHMAIPILSIPAALEHSIVITRGDPPIRRKE